jgi:hypothetical protein
VNLAANARRLEFRAAGTRLSAQWEMPVRRTPTSFPSGDSAPTLALNSDTFYDPGLKSPAIPCVIAVVKKMFRYSNVFFYNPLHQACGFRNVFLKNGINGDDPELPAFGGFCMAGNQIGDVRLSR